LATLGKLAEVSVVTAISALHEPPAVLQLKPYPVTGAPSVEATAVHEQVTAPEVTGQDRPEGVAGEVNGAAEADSDCGAVTPKLVLRLT